MHARAIYSYCSQLISGLCNIHDERQEIAEQSPEDEIQMWKKRGVNRCRAVVQETGEKLLQLHNTNGSSITWAEHR